jgi:hypothetical protein
MQNVVAIGCFVVLLLVGIPFAIKYPWRVAMVVSFFAAHIAVMVGYAVLIERLTGSQHPAARRFVAAHATVATLLADHDLPDGPRYGKATRVAAQTVIYLSIFVFYGWLLLSLGDVLDWLEAPPRDEG